MIRKSKVFTIGSNPEWKAVWSLKIKGMKALAVEKGLTLGEAMLRLMEVSASLYAGGKLAFYPDKGKVNKAANIVLVVPRAHEEEWELAKRKARGVSVQEGVPVVNTLLALVDYALSHPDVLDRPNDHPNDHPNSITTL